VGRENRLCVALHATRPAYTREAVYQQTRRWLSAGVFEAMVHDLRVLLRLSEGRAPDPTAAVLDSRTLRSTPESGSRGGYDGAKRKKGSKVHAAVDTLGHLLALFVSPANEQERAWVGELAEALCKRPRASRWI
jgi:transposase